MIKLRPPLRRDGTPKRFWFDPEGGHVIYLRDDGSMVALGWDCKHEVVECED